MNIEITDYLSISEMKSIAAEVFKKKVEGLFSTEAQVTRVLSNMCYDMVYSKVDEVAGLDIEEHLPAKVRQIIEGLTEFSIFNKPDAWSKETNAGYQILERCLVENKHLISLKVVGAINAAPKKFIRDVSEEAFKSIVERAITGK